MKKTRKASLTSFAPHILLLALGAAFLLTDAFHGNIWFDESYSVAIANHSFADIWTIGSADVHPVLYYWALHALSLFTGESILAFRLFSILGALALALLGLTHIRRLFSARAGMLFSFLALFTPYIAIMAVQIRMYSWITFFVMLCALYAYRIYAALQAAEQGVRHTGIAGADARAVPVHWWIIFFASCLVSAYLHYFGVISAFAVALMLFVYLVLHRRQTGHALRTFAVGAVAVVACYLPWLLILVGQLFVVSGTYWIHLVFPLTVIEMAAYPVYTSQMSFALQGAYGLALQVVSWVLTLALVAILAVIAISLIRRFLRTRPANPSREGRHKKLLTPSQWPPWALALGFYLLVVVLAVVLSVAARAPMLYYRYLFIAIGPFLLCGALLLSKVRQPSLLAGFCTIYLVFSFFNQGLLIKDDYSADNQAPLDYFSEQAGSGKLVLSSDIGIEGVTAVTFPDIPQTYLDWQPGNWGQAYDAYAPTLSSVKTWGDALDDYHGQFIVLGGTETRAMPVSVGDIVDKYQATVVKSETFYRPYEKTWFTITTLEKA